MADVSKIMPDSMSESCLFYFLDGRGRGVMAFQTLGSAPLGDGRLPGAMIADKWYKPD